jgi:hypothetical protein
MQLQKFTRRPLVVDGTQVTDENFEEVAKWCDGEIHTEPKGRYIKVKVQNPLTPRQTKAFVGDWVLMSTRGFKVYTSSGLKNAFSQNDARVDSGEDGRPFPAPFEDDLPEESSGFFHPEENEGRKEIYPRDENIFDRPQELLTTDQPVDPKDQISGKK